MLVRGWEEILIRVVIATISSRCNDSTIFRIRIVDRVLFPVGAGRPAPRTIDNLGMHIGSINYAFKTEGECRGSIVADLDRNKASTIRNSRNPCQIVANSGHNSSSVGAMLLTVSGSCVVVRSRTRRSAEIPSMPIVNEAIAVVIDSIRALVQAIAVDSNFSRIIIHSGSEVFMRPVRADVCVGDNHSRIALHDIPCIERIYDGESILLADVRVVWSVASVTRILRLCNFYIRGLPSKSCRPLPADRIGIIK